MLKQVEKEHVRELIDGGTVTPLPVACSSGIESLLAESYPMKAWGSVIDWRVLPNTTELLWMQVDDDAAVAWAKTTTAGQHQLGVLFYNDHEPCLVGEFADVIRNLDVLIWQAPGNRLVIGADVGASTPAFSKDVIEYDGKETLIGTKA